MNVPLLDLQAQYASLRDEMRPAVERVLESQRFVLGDEVRRLESSGETEIASEEIGLQVLEALKSLDDVAFVRYASVYRDFSHAEDFENVIAEINAKIARDTDSGT